jgi:Zn-dependent peptidase ImmA (M78 family)
MNYKNSRDAAWQLLLKNKISSLPVNLSKICKAENIKLCSYKEGTKLILKLQLEDHTVDNDAFSMGRVIFYNDQNIVSRQRFSIAHEMGHIFLHSPREATVYNREPSPNDNPFETEANIFASRLLAPLCVLHYLNVQSPEEIAEICNISIASARIRMERLRNIRKRDEVLLRSTGRGCFLLSPYERAVFQMFEQFIETHRND